MKNKMLFITSDLSRQLIILAKKIARSGTPVAIAAPENKNSQFFDGPEIRLRRAFGHLFGKNKIRGFGSAIAFDKPAARLAERAGIPASGYNGGVGIDLSVWNPGAVSGNRQTMLLGKYNIAPHQKMIIATDPDEKSIRALILGLEGSERNDFVIALYGALTKKQARRISRRLEDEPRIIYLGNEPDLPTLMRASFAVMSFSDSAKFYKIAALAMGRMTAWKKSKIAPNVAVKDDFAAAAFALLDMPAKERERFEKENVVRAAQFDMDKIVAKLKKLVRVRVGV
ncbi:MAG: hypothetical protein LBL46_02545 [Rickettsiales bacterium]|jgi:hypothetical protein|nr:hypothetical protein [Rickettsiales bacterium]